MRIEFDFGHELDDAFSIDVKKSRILFHPDLGDGLEKFLSPIRREAEARYRRISRDDANQKNTVDHSSANKNIANTHNTAKPQVPDTEAADWDDAKIISDDELPLITPKMERVIDLLREAFLNGRKVIVFALFNRIGDLLRQACADFVGIHWGAINGSTPQQERQAIVDTFTEFDGAACLVLNPKAAGAGLNITAATVVIHFTPVWNPALEAQASARAHRRGQTEPVTIYRLFYKDTVEEVMLERSAWKSDLANETLPVSSRDADDLKRALEISPVRT